MRVEDAPAARRLRRPAAAASAKAAALTVVAFVEGRGIVTTPARVLGGMPEPDACPRPRATDAAPGKSAAR